VPQFAAVAHDDPGIHLGRSQHRAGDFLVTLRVISLVLVSAIMVRRQVGWPSEGPGTPAWLRSWGWFVRSSRALLRGMVDGSGCVSGRVPAQARE
jgi:hypothetical protein